MMVHDLYKYSITPPFLQKRILTIYPATAAAKDCGVEEFTSRVFQLCGPERACNRGFRALTKMLIFGRKSASYCTHKAATAANCFQTYSYIREK